MADDQIRPLPAPAAANGEFPQIPSPPAAPVDPEAYRQALLKLASGRFDVIAAEAQKLLFELRQRER